MRARLLLFAALNCVAIETSFGQPYSVPAAAFSNIFGGASGADAATGLAVDGSANVAVIGTTNSPDFPVTNAYQPRIANPPLAAFSNAGAAYPSLGGAVDVTSLAASSDGSVIYAASDSGIYRSGDSGATWTHETPGIAGATAMAVDGASVNTVYAATPLFDPDAAEAIYKSLDGGNTWTEVSNLHFSSLLTPSQLGGVVYGAGYRSRDGGMTWTNIGPHMYSVFALALAPSDPSVVYTVASDGLLYRSSDGGDTWTTPGAAFTAYPNDYSLYVSALAVASGDENTIWALTEAGTLSQSTDGGATFATVGQVGQSTEFLSTSGKNFVVGGQGGSSASFDGGTSWQRVSSYASAALATPSSILVGLIVSKQGFLTKWSADGGAMLFSTFLDASGPIASDPGGNTWVATGSLTKFDPSGNELVSTPLAPFAAAAIALDSSGNVYLAGANGQNGTSDCTAAQNIQNPVIMEFSPRGKLLFSKTLSEVCAGTVYGIAVDASGALYVAGNTSSTSLSTTSTAIQPTVPAPPAGQQVSPLGAGFLEILSPQLGALTYLSYIGGGESAAHSVAVDAHGNVYATGSSIDSAVPFKPTGYFRTCAQGQGTGFFAFAVKLNPSSSTPAWFSEIGGGCGQPAGGSQLALDASGDVWIGGATASGIFPMLAPLEVQGNDQGFLSELSPDGTQLLFSSYGPGSFALGPGGTLYQAGSVAPNPPKLNSTIVPGLVETSAVVEKAVLSGSQAAVIDAIPTVQPPVGDANPQILGFAPGELIQITGRGLGPSTAVGAEIDATGRVATSLGGTRVLMNGVAAPLISVQESSVLCMTPFEVSGQTSATIQIERNGNPMPGVSAGVKPVTLSPPVLAVVNGDGTLNSQSNPAHTGQLVILYATGFGATNPVVPDGFVYQSPLPAPVYSVDGFTVKIPYAGPAPGMVAGIWQINLIAPEPMSPGSPVTLELASAYMIGPYTPSTEVAVWVAP